MKTMMMSVLVMMLVGCAAEMASKAETPQEAASEISELLQKKDYSTLFPERYSEWHKVKSEGVEPEVAIKKLSGMFEKQHELLVSIFDQLSSAEFTMSKNELAQESETGDVATATVSLNGKDMPYTLYKMKNGLWGFHL